MSRIPAPSRSAVRAGLLLAVLLAGTTLLQLGQSAESPYDPDSARGTGLLALKLWLNALGYRVSTNEGTRFSIPTETELLFSYPGDQRITEAEAETILTWVERGGTLAFVGPGPGQGALAAKLEVDAEEVGGLGSLSLDGRRRLWQVQPLLPDAPADLGRVEDGPLLQLGERIPAAPALASDTHETTLAVLARGKGWIWLISPRHAMTNAGLQYGDDGFIVPALLRGVAKGRRVVFDTYHRFGPSGRSGPMISSLRDWLMESWGGRSLLLLVVLTFVFRLAGGRRLGPPLIAAFDAPRREAAEFAVALAELYHRGRQTQATGEHHKLRLKRALGRPWQIGADLDDRTFVDRLRLADPAFAVPPEALLALLGRLGTTSNEAELVKLVDEVDALAPPALSHSWRT